MSVSSFANHANAEGTRPATSTEQPDDVATSDLVSLDQLRTWGREDLSFFLEYRDPAEAEEAAVYGVQWTEDEVLSLADTDREPLVHNHIQKNIFAMYGWRADNRFEIKYKPNEISDTTEAQILTEVDKSFWNDAQAEYEMALAALQQYIGPFGCVYNGFEQDDPTRPLLKVENVNWREMRIPRRIQRADMLDAERVSRERWMPLARVQNRWPDAKEGLAAWAARGSVDVNREMSETVDYGGDAYSPRNMTPISYMTARKEVRVTETWYRVAKPGFYIKTPTGKEVFDPHNAQHQYQALLAGPRVIEPGTVHCVYYCTWYGGGKLEEGKSPYSHPYFPYVFLWGLRDHEGIPQGAVHALIDPQRVLNWTKSKLLWLAQGNQWLLPDGTVQDLEKFAEAAGRPDGIMSYLAEQGMPEPRRLDATPMIAANEALHMSAKDDIKEIGGSPEEVRGQESNADSGIGIQLRQQAAMRQQGIFLDNEQRATIQIGLMRRSMIQDRVTDETIVRITQPNGAEALAVINVGDPLRRQQLTAVGYQVYGSVTRGNYDTTVILSPKSATAREQRAREQQALVNILSPTQRELVADILVLQTDIPDKEKIAERLSAYIQTKLAPPMPMGPMGPGGLPPMPGAGPAPVPLGPPPGPPPGAPPPMPHPHAQPPTALPPVGGPVPPPAPAA